MVMLQADFAEGKQHAAALTAHQEQLTQKDKNHAELASIGDRLATALKVQEAKTALTQVGPIKGSSQRLLCTSCSHADARDSRNFADAYDDIGAPSGRLPV